MNKPYDNSQISTYQSCPFSYYLQYVKGIRKMVIDDTNAAMNFGSVFHKYLENHYKGLDITEKSLLGDYNEPENLPQYSKKAVKLFIETYRDKYRGDGDKFKVKEVEKLSKVKVGKHDFVVKKDGVIEMNDNIFGLEHKTTKSISYNYFDKYFINSQITAQCYTTQQDYGQCSGVLLNVGEIKLLKRKPTGNYDATEQTQDGWLAIKFNRDFVNRTKHEIEDWFDNTSRYIDRIEDSKETGVWLKNKALWGGMICSKCQYKELCKVSKGINLDESVMDCLYETCDPYEYLEV